MKRLCQTDETVEFNTPGGGTMVYGACKKHEYVMMMIHAPALDMRLITAALLEALSKWEANTGTRDTKGPTKGRR